MEGYVNVDVAALPGVDVVCDLDHKKALPFPDDSVEEIVGNHILEHITDILPLMQELHRVSVSGARAIFRVPHGASDVADEDPTHVRRMFPNSFGYFSQPYYWRADYGYRGDWEVDEVQLALSDLCKARSPEEALGDVMRYRNMVDEMAAILTAVKPIRMPKKELQSPTRIVFIRR